MLPVRTLDLDARPAVGDSALEFLRELGGPSLVRVVGRDRSRVRGLSVLLHGNEPSSILAVHHWLRTGPRPAVDVLLFIGNVASALLEPPFSHRMLPGGRDLNRIYVEPFDGEDGAVARASVEAFREAGCEAIVDIHNTTGRTVPHAICTQLGDQRLLLASLFADFYVHMNVRVGSLVEAVESIAPAVVVEVGQAGDPTADEVAYAGIWHYVNADELGPAPHHTGRVTVLDDMARIEVDPDARFDFGHRLHPDVDITFRAELDTMNFHDLSPGAAIGWLAPNRRLPLRAVGPFERDVTDECLRVRDGVVELACRVTPVMLTVSERAVKADCLGYFMRSSTTAVVG